VTKTAIRKVPTTLPHARIYLDDLFEIEDILSKEYASLPAAPSISFEYEIDNIVTMNTREDLIQHEGYADEFSLKVVSSPISYAPSIISIIGIGHTQFDLPYFLNEQAWSIFGKIEQVFKARTDLLKNVAQMIPWWIICLPMLWGILCTVSLIVLHRAIIAVSLVVTIGGLLAIPLCIGTIGIWRKNRIYFRYSRQDQKQRIAAWKGRVEKLLWLLLGMTLGLIGDRLKH